MRAARIIAAVLALLLPLGLYSLSYVIAPALIGKVAYLLFVGLILGGITYSAPPWERR